MPRNNRKAGQPNRPAQMQRAAKRRDVKEQFKRNRPSKEDKK